MSSGEAKGPTVTIYVVAFSSGSSHVCKNKLHLVMQSESSLQLGPVKSSPYILARQLSNGSRKYAIISVVNLDDEFHGVP